MRVAKSVIVMQIYKIFFIRQHICLILSNTCFTNVDFHIGALHMHSKILLQTSDSDMPSASSRGKLCSLCRNSADGRSCLSVPGYWPSVRHTGSLPTPSAARTVSISDSPPLPRRYMSHISCGRPPAGTPSGEDRSCNHSSPFISENNDGGAVSSTCSCPDSSS